VNAAASLKDQEFAKDIAEARATSAA